MQFGFAIPAERVAGKYGGGYGSPREPWAAIIAPIL